jgi:hypothetical protein
MFEGKPQDFVNGQVPVGTLDGLNSADFLQLELKDRDGLEVFSKSWPILKTKASSKPVTLAPNPFEIFADSNQI